MKGERMATVFVLFMFMFSSLILSWRIYTRHEIKQDIQAVEITPSFYEQTPEQGLYDALLYYDIHCPEIVYGQAILESGLGNSPVYRRTNNLFGLYNSRKKDYYSFNHWTESVIAYRDYIQNRYNPPNDYYRFLTKIKYASDPNYISKLKKIVTRENDKRSCIRGDTIRDIVFKRQ